MVTELTILAPREIANRSSSSMASLVTFDLAGAATLIAGLRLRGYGYPSFKLLAEVLQY